MSIALEIVAYLLIFGFNAALYYVAGIDYTSRRTGKRYIKQARTFFGWERR